MKEVSSADNESATLCRKKRSDRPKRHSTSSSSSAAHSDQQEQEEEVALSLILLSMNRTSSVFESYRRISINGADQHCLKAPRKRFKSSQENEVNSPKTLIKKSGSDHKMKGNSCNNSNKVNECKFICIICKKGFPSYQALGGHRASHKKFKGCSAPTVTENTLQTYDFQEKIDECKKIKEHKCPICFRIFPSGQALGGHKRSHLIGDQTTRNIQPSFSTQKRIPEIRSYLDLNLPAPVEEECNEFQTWWIGITN